MLRACLNFDSFSPQDGGLNRTRHLTPTLSPVGDGGEGA